MVQAYFDCRKSKRNSRSALAFEIELERNLIELYDELMEGRYQPGNSICFVITRPKPREVWAAQFRDRIIHHLLYNHVSERFHRSFIADSCACIPGRGTSYCAERLEGHIRSITSNWSQPAYYLKGDLANFFVSIDKRVVLDRLARKIHEPWWMALAEQTLMHDPRKGVEVRGDPALFDLVPPHKRLTNADADHGLPIGNLSSQFFANVLLDGLDQFVKHRLKCRYVRYVDDFVLLHESPQWLHKARLQIEEKLAALGLQLNPRKTFIQPIYRGVDMVGQVIKPWRRETRRRTYRQAIRRTVGVPAENLFETANSYFGLLRQASASHRDRCRLANALRRRGQSINLGITQIHRRK
ncbi:retron-type reverse transcriptase [Paludibacterium purpuratum]|uniref:Retron-type reverse transcriptase n=2 Tax=Paludibacterium purpuratum TaxID=1144873 RepID=A0A4R7BB31_9NEIS|nr:retron-type reverse transcriptase [Paludibacterium purpuratum]